MKTGLNDGFLAGPMHLPGVYDAYERTVLADYEQGEDKARTGFMHNLMSGFSRPLSWAERYLAANDPGNPARVYAPAAKRVHKRALPWDEEILREGRSHTITAESARHPGDSSDPAEFR